MDPEQWTAVDRYLTDLVVRPDAALQAALESSTAAGLPAIHVAPNQGKLLFLLAQIQGARNILEIGTLGGYSAIWMARALAPGGRLITLESDPAHADVARENIARAGLADVVEIRIGPALETLPRLAREGQAFDLIFIDADKESYPDYFTWSLNLSHRGSLIIVDNVVRKGAILNPPAGDQVLQAVRRFLEMLATEPRVNVTVIQTVGSKGYDGLAIARVVGDVS